MISDGKCIFVMKTLQIRSTFFQDCLSNKDNNISAENMTDKEES
jgi:hypothetical protein